MKIEKALRCFIPELIGGGYSGEYIYYYTKKIFFEAPVNSIEALNVFLDRFDFKEKNRRSCERRGAEMGALREM